MSSETIHYLPSDSIHRDGDAFQSRRHPPRRWQRRRWVYVVTAEERREGRRVPQRPTRWSRAR